ncbi:MAG: alanine dehydrogenase [Acidobacteriota bacterium]|jgi:alanine dehydrogenase|nr:alanine dehydrogenase [Acidobacteriota bacterium]
MDIGIPKEARPREHRVALAPSGVRTLVQQGHRVWVESDAGLDAGHPNSAYESAGASIAYSREEVLERAGLVATVYAPLARDYEHLEKDQVVLGFWALPATRPEDFKALLARGVTAVGIEAIEDAAGRAPVRTSMSEIAGSLAVTLGSSLMLNEYGGKGILLGGVAGVPPAHFVILGAGVLGRAAARAAIGLGAQVTLLDRSVQHLRDVGREIRGGYTTMLATRPNIEMALSFADLVLGAVAVSGQRAPVIVTREMLQKMKPRTVVMDLSIDMGGCFETSRPTTLASPTYEVDGILHMCVPNLPSVAARTATKAFTNATLPYLQTIAEQGIEGALREHPDLARGILIYRGRCANEDLARSFGVECHPVPVEG